MDCNPKNRGRKHVLNKSKYNKNKPKADLPKSNTKPKSLESNWDRYGDIDVLGEELAEEYVPVGSDFSLLANAPLSKGSHFQFKAEAHKIKDIERTSVDTSGLFNIDLNSIALSLSTIPFNERCGLPDDYFSDTQRNIMIQSARNNEEIYTQSLLRQGINIISTIHDYFLSSEGSTESLRSEKHRKFLVGSDSKCNSIEDDNNDPSTVLQDRTSSLASKITEVSISDQSVGSKGTPDPPSTSETESLQQWLDDVLGD